MRPKNIDPIDYRAITDASRHVMRVCGACRDAGEHKTYGKHWNTHWDSRHPQQAKRGWVAVELADGSCSEISLQLYQEHKKAKEDNFETHRLVRDLQRSRAELAQGMRIVK